MFNKLKIVSCTILLLLMVSQFVGCLPQKGLVMFTGHWVTVRDPETGNEKKSCVEGGYQCAVTSTGMEVELTSDMMEAMR